MNYRLLSKLLGLLLFLVSAAMAFCLAFSYWDQKQGTVNADIEAFTISVGVTFLAGCILFFLGRHGGNELLRKEAVAIVGLGWFLCASFGALPYILCEPGLDPIKAFFESMSGFTTTGSTVIKDLDQFPRDILLWRSLTQWLGGVGILVLFVALLSSLGVGSKTLFHHESSAKTSGGLKARMQDVALRLWQIYLTLSTVCCLGLIYLGMDVFESICHAMTAVATGGFSPRNESIAAYQSPAIELWLAAFMILGGISFMLYAWLLRGRWDRWKIEEETKYYLVVLFLAMVFITANLVIAQDDYDLSRAVRDTIFQVAALATTAGYASADYDQWPSFSKMLLMLLMLIGGCVGSTAGSIKAGRWILFIKIVRVEVVQAFRPNRVFSLHLNGNLVDDQLKIQTVFFIAMAGVLLLLSTVVVTLLEPSLDWGSCLASVIATLFNIGPGFGAVGPTQTFADLGPSTQIFLSLLMLLGRLEFFAVIVLFMPSLWKKY